MDSLNDSRTFHLHDCLSDFLSVLAGEDEFSLSCAWCFDLAVLVNIAISVSAEYNRLFPACDIALNVLYEDWSAENCSVKFATDYSVRAWCKLFEVVFFYAGCVARDCSAFYADSEPFDCRGRFISYFVICVVTVLQAQIIIFGFQIDERLKKFFFDNRPQNSGHFIAVEFGDCVLHLNFCHNE